jgi:hypothetical protein
LSTSKTIVVRNGGGEGRNGKDGRESIKEKYLQGAVRAGVNELQSSNFPHNLTEGEGTL